MTRADEFFAGLTSAERADVAAMVVESRTAQGLPPTVTDPAVIARLAAVLVGGGRVGHKIA